MTTPDPTAASLLDALHATTTADDAQRLASQIEENR